MIVRRDVVRVSAARRALRVAAGVGVALLLAAPAQADEPRLGACVTDAERRQAEATHRNEAFRGSTVPLGPLYWASADGELTQALMLYWRILDVEEGTRLTLVLPLFVDHCAPDANTWIGPFGFWGGQTDVAGTAGWWGPYYFRRDAKQQSDVVFPVFWSLRDQEAGTETWLLGPHFRLKRPGSEVFGLAPFYAGYRADDGGYFDIAPGFARWGDGDVQTPEGVRRGQRSFWLLQTWARSTATSDTLLSLPFWFSHHDHHDGSFVRMAPGFAHWGDEQTTMLALGPYFSRDTATSTARGLVPLWLSGRGEDGSYFDVVPPLAWARWGDETDRTDVVLQTLYRRSHHGFTLWSAPFVFASAGGEVDYTVVPPLAFARFSARDGKGVLASGTLLGPAFLFQEQRALTFGLLPLYAGHRSVDDAGEPTVAWDLIPPLLTWRSSTRRKVGGSTARASSLVVGPFYDFQRDGPATGQSRVTGLLGLFHAGEHSARSLDDTVVPWRALGLAPRRYWLAPPLLSGHYEGADATASFYAGFYRLRTPTETHRGFLPLFAQGRTAGGSTYDVAPLALVGRWGDATSSTVVAGQTYYTSDELTQAWRLVSPPFVSAGEDGRGGHHLLIPPLAYARWGEKSDEVNTVAGPWLSFRDGADETWAFVPFVAGGSGEASSWLLGPGFARWTSATETNLLVAQTWLQTTDRPGDEDAWRLWSVPFYFGSVDEASGAYTHAIPPALTFVWGDEAKRYRVITGWFDLDDEAGRDHGFFPLFVTGASKDRHDVAGQPTTPLVRTASALLPEPARTFIFGRWPRKRLSYTAAPGFLHVGSDESELTLVGQTYWARGPEGTRLGSVPFFFSSRSPDGVDGQERFLDVVPPLLFARWGDGEAGGLWAGPYLSVGDAHRSWTGVAPVYLAHESPDARFWATPVAAQWGDNDEEHLWVLQTYASWRPRGYEVWSVPFYFSANSSAKDGEDRGYDVIPPLLYGRWRDGGDSLAITGPHFDVRLGEDRWTGVAPLFLSASHPDGGFALAPGFWRSWDRASTTTWALQTRVSTTEHSWDLASHPFYYGGVDGKGGYHHLVPLALTFLWGEESEGVALHNTWIGPFLSLQDRRGSDVGFLPLFLTGGGERTPLSPALDDTLASVLGDDATRAFTAPEGFDYTLGPGYLSLADRGGRESTHVVGQTLVHVGETASGRPRWQVWSAPFYFGANDGQRRYHVIPPLLSGHGEDEKDQSHTTVMLPLAYADWAGEGRHTRIAGPWIEHDRPDARYRALLPVWLDAETDKGFLQMWSPFVWRWGDKERQHERAVGPLVWHRRDGAERETIVFPFWWDFERRRFDVTVAGGVVWRVAWQKEKDPRSILIAPGYARYEDDEEVLQVAGPVGWSTGKGAHQEAWSLHLGPAVSFWSYHKDHIRWRALLGAVGYEREGDTEQLTVFFVKAPPQKVARPPS